ncbi:MAG: aminopeptidase P family protein [Eubacterium sp.]|jgi:Xaa-Pro aminopeptidase|nr:aminopeptidase P family protein [Eubacterium sp.]MCH4046338.1 aminopeptidase P family protein [Eubacterium sp.]MCH4079433.1 aminopeptidase P family protein [Eubacterium sp.]MCH4111017.1 aminopeptidase P family protein [Eubacterium sp.]MCI1307159.1 aminopeptidase P family protein [Eubacterium sp.]
MKKEIVELREKMKENGIDVYFVPSGDYHSSEYVNDYFKEREFASGLTGESGELIVDSEGAYLWTDGRYFLQAETQLAGSEIELMRMAEPGVPTVEEFLEDLAKKHKGFTFGYYGRVLNADRGNELKDLLSKYDVQFQLDKDLVGEVWTNRPELKPTEIYELPLSTVGKTCEQKLADVRKAMADKGADYLLITDLMESAWLFNLRADDIAYTPVFFGYTLLSQDDVKLFVMDGALKKDASGKPVLPSDQLDFVQVGDYYDIDKAVAALPADKTLWVDEGTCNYLLSLQIPSGMKVVNEMTPIAMMKAQKNETEIKSTLNAHLKDGVAMVNLIYWLKNHVGKEKITELDVAAKLRGFRAEQEGFFDISFETIAGYGTNAAIIHYAPTPETDTELKPEGFLLLDSGGHYMDGTTDITRTIKLGPVTQEMIDGYTYVLKSHIAMATAEITPDQNGIDLDRITRAPMRAVGLDFKHGLSHGIGHLLSVHEGPNILRRVPTPIELRPNMIMSDEPGLYIDGKYGIRTENEVLLKENEKGNIVFQSITYCPYERDCINTALLTDEELEWVNNYNKDLREKLVPLLGKEQAEFVMKETEPLTK